MDIKWISGMNHVGMVESGTNSIYEFEVASADAAGNAGGGP